MCLFEGHLCAAASLVALRAASWCLPAGSLPPCVPASLGCSQVVLWEVFGGYYDVIYEVAFISASYSFRIQIILHDNNL